MAQVLKVNYLMLARLLASRLLLAVFLAAIPVTLGRLGIVDSPFPWVLAVAGMGILIFTVYRALYGIRVVQCARVLRHYPLEFRPRVVKKGERWTTYGDVFEVRVTTRGQHGAPLMLAVPAAGRRRWPGGTEEGVWVAGDLPFGGVMVLPGSKAMLFMKPAHWEKTAARREQADAERTALAQRARLTDRTKNAVMMRPGA
ncbi:hypothetical protein [Streptomyces sp. NPDC101150]|uniref:hypothetical protein n=1 Tax=Streptomyces sp. NPDC101150 TaxID=3366114 RepID=UPI003829E555